MVLCQGIEVAILSKHLGHSNIGTTVNIYAHQTMDMVKKVGESTAKTFSLTKTS
jgi:site-specific recombinase XerD